MRDFHNKSTILKSIVPQVASGTVTGTMVDCLGADSVEFVIDVGAIVAAGNITFKLQEGDASDGSGATDVAAADQLGTVVDPAVASTPQKLGYIGSKRYVRVVATLNSGTSVAIGATAVLTNLHQAP